MIRINENIDSDQLGNPFNKEPIDKPDSTRSGQQETIRIEKTETI